MILKSLKELLAIAKLKTPKKLVVAAAEDIQVLMAIKQAYNEKLIIPILIGNKSKIIEIASQLNFNINGIEIVDIMEPSKSCVMAVSYIREKKAQILMKGMVSTSVILKAVLDKEKGIAEKPVMSHFAMSELKSYHKLLCVTDAAMNIAPDMNQKTEILNNAVGVLNSLGYSNPKVAIVCPIETVNAKIESTVHASMLTQMAIRNQIKNCIIDGPLALDNAISKQAAEHKGINSDVAGDADILLMPNLDAGNALYKCINFLAGGVTAAIIIGAKAPFVLTSRADSEESKLMSIALAAAIA